MKITIYGTECCSKCNQVLSVVESLVKEFGIDAEVEKINDIGQAIEKGIMSLPALAINDKIKISGRIATKDEIKELLNV